jgi:hypothetical protein
MREGGNLNLYALVFYLDNEGIRSELLRLLMSDFGVDYIHYITASGNPAAYLDYYPLIHNICIANAPILDLTEWLELLHNKVQSKFFNDPKHGNFRYEDFFIERIEE